MGRWIQDFSAAKAAAAGEGDGHGYAGGLAGSHGLWVLAGATETQLDALLRTRDGPITCPVAQALSHSTGRGMCRGEGSLEDSDGDGTIYWLIR